VEEYNNPKSNVAVAYIVKKGLRKKGTRELVSYPLGSIDCVALTRRLKAHDEVINNKLKGWTQQ